MLDRLLAKLSEEARVRRAMLEEGKCTDYTQYKVLAAEIKLLKDISLIAQDYEMEEDFEGD